MKRITSRIVKLFFVLILLLNTSFVYANDYLIHKTFEINKSYLEVANKISEVNVIENAEVKDITEVEEISYNTYNEPKEYYIEGNSIKVASIYNHLMNDDGSYYYLNHGLD